MLLSPMLSTSVQTAAALPIPAGMVAVTLQFCVQQAVANYVTPGSQVAIFNTFVNGKSTGGACSVGSATSGSGADAPHARLVLPKVLVLAVGEGTAAPPSSTTTTADGPATGSGAATPSTIYLTMAVTQADAETLIELGESGSPYLALLTSASTAKTDVSYQP
jgi:pilus assembly protein CpaB